MITLQQNSFYVCLNLLMQEYQIYHIENWLRRKDTLIFLSLWEKSHNPDFIVEESEELIKKAGPDYFIVKLHEWINKTNACGLVIINEPEIGVFTHVDIAFDFLFWISPEFRYEVIRDYNSTTRRIEDYIYLFTKLRIGGKLPEDVLTVDSSGFR